MGALTAKTAKALLPVRGRPFCLYLLENLSRAGFTRALLVAGHMAEQFREIPAKAPTGLAVEVIDQYERNTSDAYGTAMAVRAAEQDLKNEPFVVLAGDQLYGVTDLTRIRTLRTEAAIVCAVRKDDPRAFGVLRTDREKVLEIVEKPEDPPSDLVNMSLYRFPPDALNAFRNVKASPRGEYEITDAVNALARQGRVRFFELEEPALHISNPEDIDAAHAFVTMS
jgi:bifunctional UDP-N-acetylglucosamine pyrophosphorylase/glucosamine-1-phosphate N-acetyltransferase